jgi:hypothetical protein
LIDRLPELANFAVGSLFFGQFLGERPFSLLLAGAAWPRGRRLSVWRSIS